MKSLLIFTGQFPYSQYVECFLEDEIVYLSRVFEKITIVPMKGDSKCRDVPSNCIIAHPIISSKLSLLINGLYNSRTFYPFIKDFFNNKVYSNINKIIVWIKGMVAINNLLNSNFIKGIEDSINKEDVICYYYWGKWSNLLSIFLNRDCHHLSRFHGSWDLWDENISNYAPLRKELSESLDVAAFISHKGEDFFREKYPTSNTSYNPLGSIDYGLKPKKVDNVIRIVSCSTVYPLKRVELIFDSIVEFSNNHNELKVEWYHIGGGPTFNQLLAKVNFIKLSNLSVMLLGNLNHKEVIQQYQSISFDIFINLSINEGIPVSIMEAISFDIPIVATAVGGNVEIVTNETGILVSSSPNINEVSAAISFVLEKNIHPRKYWEKHYDADKNYSKFANLLSSI